MATVDSRTVTVRMTIAQHQALKKAAAADKKAVNRFITELLAEHVDGFVPSMPKGGDLRHLKAGWLSKLYQDRYQLVAVWDQEEGFIIEHLHLYDGKLKDPMVIRGEQPIRFEAYVVDAPGVGEDKIMAQLALDLGEWGG